MKMWKGNGNITTLLFSLKGHEILYQERRGQVKTIVMERFNGKQRINPHHQRRKVLKPMKSQSPVVYPNRYKVQ